jgi:hypothetical protein
LFISKGVAVIGVNLCLFKGPALVWTAIPIGTVVAVDLSTTLGLKAIVWSEEVAQGYIVLVVKVRAKRLYMAGALWILHLPTL